MSITVYIAILMSALGSRDPGPSVRLLHDQPFGSLEACEQWKLGQPLGKFAQCVPVAGYRL